MLEEAELQNTSYLEQGTKKQLMGCSGLGVAAVQRLLEHPLGLDSNPGLAVLPGCAVHSAVNVAFELWSGWPCL